MHNPHPNTFTFSQIVIGINLTIYYTNHIIMCFVTIKKQCVNVTKILVT